MQLGDVVDRRFRLEGVVARGAIGTVHRAWDLVLGRSIALKILTGTTAAEQARFRREIDFLSRLDHPGIVRCLGSGSLADGRAYFVMEWLEGETVDVRLQEVGFDLRETVLLGQRVASA